MRGVYGEYFYGNEVSNYGKECGRVDYRTLYGAFDAVMNNDILEATWSIGDWDMVSGELDEGDEVYQYYIISPRGAEILSEWTDDPVWYNEKLNMYVSGVLHFGTSWDYVLTDIMTNYEGWDNAKLD